MARILYIGDLNDGSTALMRLRAMETLGHQVIGVSLAPMGFKKPTLAHRAMSKLGIPPDLAHANREIRRRCDGGEFDLIWLDKSLAIWPTTLRYVRRTQPKIVIAGYSPDDMAQRHSQSAYFLRGLPLYDFYFTTKTFNVNELLALGARRAVFNGNAYDPATHRPMDLTPAEMEKFGAGVGFIGTWERERGEDVLALAQAGIEVRVVGNLWDRQSSHPNLKVAGRSVYGDDYARYICGAQINLGFLRKVNRDLQTTRSIEIPACGSFMLAERSDEHLSLFEEGKEAEFFSSRGELLEKIRFYLANPARRQEIAAAGRRKCISAGYSYPERMKAALAAALALG